MRIITRRSAIQALAGVPCLMRGEDRGTAFALIGDRYHNSDYMRIGLGKTLGKDAGVGIDFCDEVKMLSAANLRGYKLLIVFRDGMLWPDGYSDENAPPLSNSQTDQNAKPGGHTTGGRTQC